MGVKLKTEKLRKYEVFCRPVGDASGRAQNIIADPLYSLINDKITRRVHTAGHHVLWLQLYDYVKIN